MNAARARTPAFFINGRPDVPQAVQADVSWLADWTAEHGDAPLIITPASLGVALLMLLAVAGCSGTSSPPAPQHANFVVVSLDMQFGAPQPPAPVGLCDPRQYTPFEMQQNGRHATYPAVAHGVFRNDCAAGTAVVVFAAAARGPRHARRGEASRVPLALATECVLRPTRAPR